MEPPEGTGDEELVFVYGTLRRKASNHYRMEEAEFVGSGTVSGRMYTIDWYPGVVLDPKGERVAGELYQVPPGLLAALDEFEGDEYERRRVDVETAAGDWIEAWVYHYLGDVDALVPRVPADWLRPDTMRRPPRGRGKGLPGS